MSLALWVKWVTVQCLDFAMFYFTQELYIFLEITSKADHCRREGRGLITSSIYSRVANTSILLPYRQSAPLVLVLLIPGVCVCLGLQTKATCLKAFPTKIHWRLLPLNWLDPDLVMFRVKPLKSVGIQVVVANPIPMDFSGSAQSMICLKL